MRAGPLQEVVAGYAALADELLSPLLGSEEDARATLGDPTIVQRINAFIEQDLSEQFRPAGFSRLDGRDAFQVVSERIEHHILPKLLLGGIAWSGQKPIKVERRDPTGLISNLEWLQIRGNLDRTLDLLDPGLLEWSGGYEMYAVVSVGMEDIEICLERDGPPPKAPRVPPVCIGFKTLESAAAILRLGVRIVPGDALPLPSLAPFTDMLLEEEDRVLATGTLRDDFYTDATASWAAAGGLRDAEATTVLRVLRCILDNHHTVVIEWLSSQDYSSGLPKPRALLHDFVKTEIRQSLGTSAASTHDQAEKLRKVQGEIERFLETLHKVVRPRVVRDQLQALDLAGVLRGWADKFQRSVPVEIICPPAIYVEASRYLLRRVVTNLLDNARSAAHDVDPRWIRVVVHRSHEEDRVELRIVNPFDPNAPPKAGATGHGLAIVRDLLEHQMKGSIALFPDPATRRFTAVVGLPLFAEGTP